MSGLIVNAICHKTQSQQHNSTNDNNGLRMVFVEVQSFLNQNWAPLQNCGLMT